MAIFIVKVNKKFSICKLLQKVAKIMRVCAWFRAPAFVRVMVCNCSWFIDKKISIKGQKEKRRFFVRRSSFRFLV
jgi:hypothetical protein